MAEKNLGRIGFVNKGAWQDGVHKLNDVVTHQGAVYACIQQHTSANGNILPSNTAYWIKWVDGDKYTKAQSNERDENIMFHTLKTVGNVGDFSGELWKKVLEFENIIFYNTIFLELFLAGRWHTEKVLLTSMTGSTPTAFGALTLKTFYDGQNNPLKALKTKQGNGFKIELWTKTQKYDTLKCRLLNAYFNNAFPQNLQFFENFDSTTEPTVDTSAGSHMVTATATAGYR